MVAPLDSRRQPSIHAANGAVADPGKPGMAAREPFRFDMTFAFDIRQREMAEIYLRRAPGTVPLVAGHRPAKEGELHTVFAAARRVFEGGGEIPPLLAKTRMGTMVAGKHEGSHGVGSAESRFGRFAEERCDTQTTGVRRAIRVLAAKKRKQSDQPPCAGKHGRRASRAPGASTTGAHVPERPQAP